MEYNILVINPGSTSDEIGYFRGDKLLFQQTVRYTPVDLKKFEGKKVTAQYNFRKNVILRFLEKNSIALKQIDAVIGRGGLVKPIPGGTYRLNKKLLRDLKNGVMGDHPSNLGGLLASELAKLGIAKAFIADPVVVDEMQPLARYSGMPENPRLSIFHALNQKRVAKLAAKKLKKKYQQCNFVVFHGGGGISIGAHQKGRVIDVNNALDGDGPFTPQRSGGVPSGGLAKMCFSGKYSLKEIKLKIKGMGGIVSYAGTSDVISITKFIQTGKKPKNSGIKVNRRQAKEILEAMVYQIAKEIGAMSTVLKGKVDGIVLSGGLAYSAQILDSLKKYIGWIAPFIIFPGGDEQTALKDAALSALKNIKSIKNYS
ncbi:MAG TPA: butyrate kinase [Elusimicrobiales bacterium]|nr:butyrate kinase [Elusimicrobiales bacterium]